MSAMIDPARGIPLVGTEAWEALWRRLDSALAGRPLPNGEGGWVRCTMLDFMLMSVVDGIAAFKHVDTRCYLTLTPEGRITLPTTPGLSFASVILPPTSPDDFSHEGIPAVQQR
jgi:hypothetical protein